MLPTPDWYLKYRTISVLSVAAICGMVVMVTITLPKNGSFRSGVSSLFFSSSKKSSSTTKPNFVFVLADDLGWNSMGYMGYDLSFVTPELDKLAASGLKLTNYYAMEYCNPSRAALLTGRYPLNMGMQYGAVEYDIPWGLRLEETLLPEILKAEGYSTYILGKWHLGHFNERYLPTARGFDSFTGYLDGQNYYYSKRDPTIPAGEVQQRDFLTMDKDCYYTYDGPNLHNYSTHLYKDLAIETIYNHDQSNPMFMYLAFQAVHIPFEDETGRGVDPNYMDDWMYEEIKSRVTGDKRQYYAMTLNVLDSAVKRIHDALYDVGMLENTYIIFASDNGGCFKGGGPDYPLRGTKFTMLEGGTKVNSFIYSYMLDSELRGTESDALMHVSDWFPTILELADITYDADDNHPLDSVSQVSAWADGTSVRTTMLYNSYSNAENYDLGDIWSTGAFAVRNEKYKLIHFYNNTYADWHYYDSTSTDDDAFSVYSSNCVANEALEGDFVYALYDLTNDPYEKNNLYDDESDDIVAVKDELYDMIAALNADSVKVVYNGDAKCVSCKVAFKEAGDYVVPWVSGKDGAVETGDDEKSYPMYCGMLSKSPITVPDDE